MMKMVLAVAVAVVAATGCAPRLAHVRKAVEISAPMSLACDWGQTRYHASREWAGGFEESNPVMGKHPATHEVDIYFAATTALVVAGAYLLPKDYRWIALGAVTAVEAKAIVNNIAWDTPMCGI